MAIIREVYDTHTDSDSAEFGSCDEEGAMFVPNTRQPQGQALSEKFNPFLMVPSTSMFEGGKNKEVEWE